MASRLFEQRDRLLDRVGRNNEIYILGHHRLLGPMVDRQSINGTPSYVRSLQTVNKPHNVICATPRLPIIELLSRHGYGIVHRVTDSLSRMKMLLPATMG